MDRSEDLVPDPEDPACSRGVVVGNAGPLLRTVPATCRRWACRECGPRNAHRLAGRIMATPGRRLLTLTLRPDPSRSLQEELDRANAAWRTLWKRIGRLQGPRARGYVKVVELTAAGTPHLHIIADCAYVSQAWLSATWDELTGAPIVDIRRVNSRAGLSRYLAKYLTKTHLAVHGRRKWSASRGFLPPAARILAPPGFPPPQWSWSPATGTRLLASHMARGWTLGPDGWWWPPARPPRPG